MLTNAAREEWEWISSQYVFDRFRIPLRQKYALPHQQRLFRTALISLSHGSDLRIPKIALFTDTQSLTCTWLSTLTLRLARSTAGLFRLTWTIRPDSFTVSTLWQDIDRPPHTTNFKEVLEASLRGAGTYTIIEHSTRTQYLGELLGRHSTTHPDSGSLLPTLFSCFLLSTHFVFFWPFFSSFLHSIFFLAVFCPSDPFFLFLHTPFFLFSSAHPFCFLLSTPFFLFCFS